MRIQTVFMTEAFLNGIENLVTAGNFTDRCSLFRFIIERFLGKQAELQAQIDHLSQPSDAQNLTHHKVITINLTNGERQQLDNLCGTDKRYLSVSEFTRLALFDFFEEILMNPNHHFYAPKPEEIITPSIQQPTEPIAVDKYSNGLNIIWDHDPITNDPIYKTVHLVNK
jgi:Arc/MetJ-type ribon-helix-helix transcriptional regulator